MINWLASYEIAAECMQVDSMLNESTDSTSGATGCANPLQCAR